jgi:hypothetical protein
MNIINLKHPFQPNSISNLHLQKGEVNFILSCQHSPGNARLEALVELRIESPPSLKLFRILQVMQVMHVVQVWGNDWWRVCSHASWLKLG